MRVTFYTSAPDAVCTVVNQNSLAMHMLYTAECSWPMRPTSTHERSSTVSNCGPDMGGGHGIRTAKWPEERCRSMVRRSRERADSSSSRRSLERAKGGVEAYTRGEGDRISRIEGAPSGGSDSSSVAPRDHAHARCKGTRNRHSRGARSSLLRRPTRTVSGGEGDA